jgi:hypothetical protein
MVTFISASSYTPGGLNALTMEQITPYITTLSCIFHKKDNTFLINIYSLYKIRYEWNLFIHSIGNKIFTINQYIKFIIPLLSNTYSLALFLIILIYAYRLTRSRDNKEEEEQPKKYFPFHYDIFLLCFLRNIMNMWYPNDAMMLLFIEP